MNQRKIFITKCYPGISYKAYKEIRKDFPGASPELAFWLYLDSQPNNSMIAITKEIYKDEIGLSRQTYRKAFDSLLEAGYIRHISDEKNYIFIEDKRQ